MGRNIRMSEAEAIRAGLIDPLVRDLVSRRPASSAAKSIPAGSPAAKSEQDGTATSGSPTKKRSRSRPAAHPKSGLEPAGTGDLIVDVTGLVVGASFDFNIVPVPKERAQVVRNPKTDKTFGFTPARTQHFHREIKGVVHRVFGASKPIAGPVRIDMEFLIAVPSSWPKWKQAAALEGLISPTGRPDMDNLEKALLDAFNGCLIEDDAYVMERRATKAYAEMPGIRARVRQTGAADINTDRKTIETLRRLRAEITDTPKENE